MRWSPISRIHPYGTFIHTRCSPKMLLQRQKHQHSILHHRHHPPWLGICSGITPRELCTLSVHAGFWLCALNWPFIYKSISIVFGLRLDGRALCRKKLWEMPILKLLFLLDSFPNRPSPCKRPLQNPLIYQTPTLHCHNF